jgi:poly(A) polymerase
MTGTTGSGASSIAGAAWLVDPVLQTVLGVLNAGGVARVVGGAVRNTLMGADTSAIDTDIATTHRPEQVTALVEAAGFKAVPTGIDHGTVTVVGDSGRRHFEVTTLRRDVETHGRRATVAFTDDWAADAARRDFTINAIYCDADGTLHDPVGGIADIAAGLVRFVGDPVARIREDYLRILRFFRFSAHYAAGPLDAAGLGACVAEQAGLARLSAERIRAELVKLLAAPGTPGVIAAMGESGIVERLFGARADVRAALRLMATEQACGLAGDAIRRLGALASAGGIDADDLKARLRLSRADGERIAAMETAAAGMGRELAELDRKAALYRRGPQAYRDGVLLAWARSPAAADDGGWRDLAGLPDRWTAPKLPVAGRDLVRRGVAPGPEVGRRLAEIEARWIASDFTAGRKELLATAAGPR